MVEFTSSELSKIIGGELFPETDFSEKNISQIVTDSRTVFKGENAVFFALVGPRNNGHNYITELAEKDISVFVVSDKGVISSNHNFILVEDTTLALQKLASYIRSQFTIPIVGITGSNGKTVVKEWLYLLLSEEYKIVRSPKSFNSQIGVPLSVLLLDHNHNLGIFEAGISQPGEMQNLSDIIAPEIGIFTNIGDAHQDNFESLEQKILEKLCLFKKSKKLIFRSDSKISTPVIREFCEKHLIEEIDWSLNSDDSKISFSINKKGGHTSIKARIKKSKYAFRIPFVDDSSIENCCHCFALINELTANRNNILPKFEKLEPIAMRLEIKQGINNCLLVNDYYNSDLNSLSIALTVLNQQAVKDHLSKMVILSDIQQTGMQQMELYNRVNDLLNQWGIDEIIGIGPVISKYADQFRIKNKLFNSTNHFIKQYNRSEFRSAAILIKGAREFTFEKISGLLQQKAHQTELQINMNALINNLNIFKGLLLPQTKIMVMVKAFSYGSGDIEIAKLLQYQNVDYLAVAIADEGVELRNGGILTPIIVMNPEQASFQNIIDYQLEPNIYSLQLLESFTTTVSQNGLKSFPIHLKIDTGMNRLGFKTREEIQKAITYIASSNYLKIKSAFSHLAASDDPDLDTFTNIQTKKFEAIFQRISSAFSYKIERHILNSAGIERFPEKQFEMVRLGIGLYGISATGLPVENIGTLKSTISQIKTIRKDETVGYSRKGSFDKASRIAIVPMGYADGLDRKLGNKNGEAFINGKRVPIVGNICMDMLMLDVTNTNVQVGEKVEFFGANISIEELAKKVQTMPYEILTGISQRVKRVYVQE